MAGKSVEELVAENSATMERLEKKRLEVATLAIKEVDQQAQVAAEYHAAELAEEERRLDAELEFQKSRIGINTVRDGLPETSGEQAARAAAEAENPVATPTAVEKVK